jgi:hypothetical protein
MTLKHYILLIGFVALICFPIINGFTKILPDIAGTENRKITSFPQPDTSKVENLSKYLEAYLTDNISVRNRMIKLYNKLNIFVFRSSPVSIKAIVGKNGWYFMAGEEIKTYNGTNLFSDPELLAFKNELLRRKKIIEQHHAHFFFAIVPNKSNIYPEYMPDHIIRSENGYGKQLLKYLKAESFPIIDLYQPLLNSKKEHELYYQTDNHWNDYGAFIAGNAILKEFHKYNERVQPLDLKIYEPKLVIEKPGNIAKMFSIENERTESNYIPTRKNGLASAEKKLNKYPPTPGFPYPQDYEFTRYITNDSLPCVLIIRDSFGTKIFPYISEQSRKCTAIYDGWEYGLNEPVIAGEKPDIVLLLVVESNLKNILKKTNK